MDEEAGLSVVAGLPLFKEDSVDFLCNQTGCRFSGPGYSNVNDPPPIDCRDCWRCSDGGLTLPPSMSKLVFPSGVVLTVLMPLLPFSPEDRGRPAEARFRNLEVDAEVQGCSGDGVVNMTG